MLDQTKLYTRWAALIATFGGDPGLLHSFAHLRSIVSEQSKFIIHIFPEYTPHDAARHLEQLFGLADRVLGPSLYDRLNAAELSLLVFGLYAHDWGMTVSNQERDAISGANADGNFVLLPDELSLFRRFRDDAIRLGKTDIQIWEDYLRQTHARRSGCRLREQLKTVGHSFAEMVGRVAEGHVLDIRDLRDPEQYPTHAALFGEVTNVAAIATYIRLVDLLDIAEDRTPFALWSIVRPRNEISQLEWHKHRALSPVAVSEHAGIRQVLITGTTDNSDVFAALADLRSWADEQFSESVEFLRSMGTRYDPVLDSSIRWDVKPLGFEPVLLRFDLDRPALLGLLSAQVYGRNKLAFVRELLQNSVDAIDTRAEVLRNTDTVINSRISVDLETLPETIRIEWRDNGIGMDRYILDNYLSKIGRSWYQSADFHRHGLNSDPISKFGIGLLSCFAVSTGLAITTKREPRLAIDSHGWQIRIPSRDGYFRVTKSNQTSVGTSIVLEIRRSDIDVTAKTIAVAIKQIAVLVKHKLILNVDGKVEEIEPVAQGDNSRHPFLQITTLDEDALTSLRSLTLQFNHHYFSPDGGYEAFFSCLLPRDLSSVTALSTSKWHFGPTTIDLDDFVFQTPTDLLLKGIANIFSEKHHHWRRTVHITLNVFKPSLVDPNLSRSDINFRSLNLSAFWKDVASHLREVITPDLASIDGRVLLVSAARLIAHIPEDAFDHAVPPNEWPVWILKSSSGLSWHNASELLDSEEIIEVPDELNYLLRSETYFDSTLRHLRHWTGSPCFVGLDATDFWRSAAASLAPVYLRQQGFSPTDLRFVTSPSDDDVPLACRVWRRQSTYKRPAQGANLSDLLTEWRRDPSIECPEIVQRAGSVNRHSADTPFVVRFPDAMKDIAGIGSLYWNQNNPKVRALVEFLLELGVRYQNGTLSAKAQQVLEYVNSSAYLGYIVPARHSGVRAGIGRYQKLIEIAADEGVHVPKPLTTEDLFPGSIGKYWNPYHYPITSWGKSKRAVGVPFG